jgi:hypothetical protein
MTNDGDQIVSVQRTISAPAGVMFAVLTDPAKHPEIDGSDMLRTGAPGHTISGLGDVFPMRMFFPAMGDYQMDNHVVEYEQDRRIAWEPSMHGTEPTLDDPQRNGSRWGYTLAPEGPDVTLVTETYDCSRSPEAVRANIDNGKVWIDGMTKSLENLDALCGGQ